MNERIIDSNTIEVHHRLRYTLTVSAKCEWTIGATRNTKWPHRLLDQSTYLLIYSRLAYASGNLGQCRLAIGLRHIAGDLKLQCMQTMLLSLIYDVWQSIRFFHWYSWGIKGGIQLSASLSFVPPTTTTVFPRVENQRPLVDG